MDNPESPPAPKVHDRRIEDKIAFAQGVDLDRADSTGHAAEEVTYREDARRHGTIHTQHTPQGPQIRVSGAHRSGRVDTRANKLAEENEVAAAFASDLSERTGRVYIAGHKAAEDSAFPDVWLQEQSDGTRVGVEFTHFDEDAISQLEKVGEYALGLQVDQVGQNIRDTIDKKNGKVRKKSAVQVEMATRSYLVLISSFPIRQSMYEALAQKVATLPVDKLFMETWLLPLKQKPFRVQ